MAPSVSTSAEVPAHTPAALLCSTGLWWDGYGSPACPCQQIRFRNIFRPMLYFAYSHSCSIDDLGIQVEDHTDVVCYIMAEFNNEVYLSGKVLLKFPRPTLTLPHGPGFSFYRSIPTLAPGMMDSFPLPYLIPTTLRHNVGFGGEGRRCL